MRISKAAFTFAMALSLASEWSLFVDAFQPLHSLQSLQSLQSLKSLRSIQPRPSSAKQPDQLRLSYWPETLLPQQRDSRLFSLQSLIDEITTASSSAAAASSSSSKRKTIFVGGKGGVGKTTVSSALAVKLATMAEEGLKVLVVSTDPAHSLGDAIDVDLRSSHGKTVTLTDPLTGGRLDACEVDAEAALEEFRESLASFDIDRLASSLGVSAEILESLGLREFSNLLNNPPPGLDELVALGNVMDEENGGGYDVVIVDTAPTGHTLRLLALPQFLDGLLGKLIKLRMKLAGLTSTLQAFLGNTEAQQRAQQIDSAMDRIEKFRRKIANLQTRLQDSEETSFVVVTVPTKLSVAESKRLVTELTEQKIAVKNIVINQCVGGQDDDSDNAMVQYYERRRVGQKKWIDKLQAAVDDVSQSEEYKSNGRSTGGITVTQFPFFDVELVGIPALGYVGSQHIVDNPNFGHLMEESNNDEGPKVIICGGKGGVGKTTTSSSLAVSMAAKGHRVALISTDPAHSLGDAIGMNLAGGKLIDCPLIGVPGTGDGSLSVLEIDPASSLSQFKGIVDQLVGGGGGEKSEMKDTIKDLGEIFDTLPAGTDEVVALAKVINLIKKGDYDRVVLDTAPTGHTLRMLSTPGFIAELIDRLLDISQKVNSNAMVKMLIGTAAGKAGASADEVESAGTVAKSQLLSFQLQMYDLEDLFADPDQTEFLIVTVPTELAVRESVRLLNDLTFEAPDMPIKVRNIVINQILQDDGSDIRTFLSHVGDGQRASIDDLEQFTKGAAKPPMLTRARYLDTEPRGVFGLKVLADELTRDDENKY